MVARKYASVTTVLDAAISNSFLSDHYARKAAERAVNEPAELSRKVRTEGKAKAVEWLKEAPREHMRKASFAGKDLHDLADRRARGEPLPEHLHDDTRLMLRHYEQWIKNEGVVFHGSELTVVNHTYGYVGALDALVEMERYGPIPVVVDAKTGATGPWPKAGVQLAAYAHAEMWWPGCPRCETEGEPAHARTLKSGARYYRKCDHVAEQPIPNMRRDMAVILKVRPTGYEMYRQPFELVDKHGDRLHLFDNTFRACLEMYRWSQVARSTMEGPIKSETDDTPFIERAQQARSTVQLHRIWCEASAAGAYTQQLHAACLNRKAELDSGTA